MKRILAALIFPALMMSCSLKYDSEFDAESSTPEIEFKNTVYTRYENNKKTMQMNADVLEQYKNNGGSYGRNVTFRTWDDNKTLVTEGSCALLGMDTKNETYVLFNNIMINNLEENFKLNAKNLKWNGKTKQLISGKEDTVYITRDDIEMQGKGFSASGISKSFNFADDVNGLITTKEKEENNEEGIEANGEEQER